MERKGSSEGRPTSDASRWDAQREADNVERVGYALLDNPATLPSDDEPSDDESFEDLGATAPDASELHDSRDSRGLSSSFLGESSATNPAAAAPAAEEPEEPRVELRENRHSGQFRRPISDVPVSTVNNFREEE
jgi:hypothetical protein